MGNKTQIIKPKDIENPQQAENSDFYIQSADRKGINRTYIQGMKPKENQEGKGANAQDPKFGKAHNVILQERPLVGVLFSISRDEYGEIFPVYIGRNNIGSNHVVDIYLTEQSVSQNHAILLIRIIPSEDGQRKIIMRISDTESEFGTYVNGERLGYESVCLKEGDVIQIGNIYRFVFHLFETEKTGLFTDKNFKATERVENRPIAQLDYMRYMLPVDDDIYPNSVSQEDEQLFYGRTQAKKEDHTDKKTI